MKEIRFQLISSPLKRTRGIMMKKRIMMKALRSVLSAVLAVSLLAGGTYFNGTVQAAEAPSKILVEGENYSKVNFTIYDYEKDPGLSGGDFLMMKAPAGAVSPQEGFLAEYTVAAPKAGTYEFDMTCLAINGNLGSTIEVKVNDGEFKAYSEENAENHGGVDGQVYKKNFFRYTLDTVPLRSGDNKITVKIATTRSTDNRYYYFLDCMEFTEKEITGGETDLVLEGEKYESINFVIPAYDKDPALSGGDFLCLKSYAANPMPEGGYEAVYKVSAQKASAYEMTMTSLTLDGINGSVFDMKVNDGEYVHYDKNNTKVLGVVDSTPYKNSFLIHKLPPVVLQAGENTITIQVKEPRSGDGRQFFFLDCIRFAPIEWNIMSIRPTGAAVGVYELGDTVSLEMEYASAASGAEKIEYKVVDFWGTEAAAGLVQAEPGASMVLTVPELQKGHYMVYARAYNDGAEAEMAASAESVSGNDNALGNENMPGNGNALEDGNVPGNGNKSEDGYVPEDGQLPGDESLSGNDAVNGSKPGSESVSGSDVTGGDLTPGGPKEPDTLKKAVKASEPAPEVPWNVCQFSVVTPLSMREKPQSSPFALDAAMLMTYYKTPGFNMDTALEYADALALAGIDTVRERYRWNDAVNPQKGSYNFDVFNTDTYFNRLKSHGIKILNMYDSAPDWAKNKKDDRLVEDLGALYQFSKDSAEHYGGVVNGWEMANEPELTNTMNYETADRLAAYIKAASIGYEDSGENPLISIPGLAYTPQYYADLLLQNDVLKYVDIYNYHNHIALDQSVDITYPSMIYQAHQKLLDQYGGEDKQMWLSEAGTYVDLPEGQSELTQEQQIKMARYLVVSTLISLAEGTDKHFYFNLTYLVERDRELGIFGIKDTPYAPYSAQAALTETFGEAVYQGELKGCPEGAYGLVFKNGNKTVVGVWSDQEAAVAVPSGASAGKLVDIMGKESDISSQDGEFHINAGIDPKYLVLEGELTEGAVLEDYRNNSSEQRAEFTKADRIILEQKYPESASKNSKLNGYTMSADQPNTVTVEVNNLNTVKMSGTIFGKGYEGWKVSPASQEVEIEPYGKQTLTFTIEATGDVVINTPAPIQFTGEFEGEKTSNCVSHVQLPGVENPEIYELIPGSDSKESWAVNINTTNNGQCLITEGDREGSVTFANSFTGGDRWTYPVLTMPEGTDFTGTKGITFHVDSEADFAGGSLGVMRVLLTEKNGSKYWTPDGFFLKEGEQQITVPWTAFSSMAGPADNNFHLDTDQITMCELGLNARVDVAPVYTVWDFGTYLGNTRAVYPVIENMLPVTGSGLEGGKIDVEAYIKEGSIPADADRMKVTVDGHEIPYTYDKDTGLVKAAANELAQGQHKVNIQFFCEDGKGVAASSQVSLKKGTVPENPDEEKPGPEDPEEENPEPGNPEEKPEPGNPDEEKPEAEKPDEKPDAGNGQADQGSKAVTTGTRKSPMTYDNSFGIPVSVVGAIMIFALALFGIGRSFKGKKSDDNLGGDI